MRILGLLTFWSLSLPLAVRADSSPDAVRAFAGQQLILAGDNGESRLKVDRGKLGSRSRNCDIAVEVHTADYQNGKARFYLGFVGTPEIVGQSNAAPTRCFQAIGDFELGVSGFASEDPAAIAAALKGVLQTPERYLTEHGIEYHLDAGPDETPVPRSPGIEHPKLLFRVEASYSEEARKTQTNGSVSIHLVVGTDGRVHQAQVVGGLGRGLDENALQAVRFWRFEPARRDSQPVPYGATVRMDFHINTGAPMRIP